MATVSSASMLVAAAARTRLRPLGLRQHGRSRLWLDDRGWWLGLVEFPSPRWSQGSGLHVGAMWLWQDVDHFTFNVSERLRGAADYRDDGQFAPVAEELALLARERIEELRCKFVDLASVGRYMAVQPVGRGLVWEPWNAGVVAALAGDTAVAQKRLSAVLREDPLVPWIDEAQGAARELLHMVHDQRAVRDWVMDRVSSCRQRLVLDPPKPTEEALARIF